MKIKTSALLVIIIIAFILTGSSCYMEDNTSKKIEMDKINDWMDRQVGINRPQMAQRGEDYQIVESEDFSYRSPSNGIVIKRLSYRIKVEPPITEDKLRSICNKIIPSQSSDIKAISFFFLLDTGVDGQYTTGKAEWAPNGRWQDAESTAPLRLEIILAKIPFYIKSSLPTSKKKKIFYDLVASQYSGVDACRAYYIIVEKYSISVEEVNNIADEGIAKNWPTPWP